MATQKATVKFCRQDGFQVLGVKNVERARSDQEVLEEVVSRFVAVCNGAEECQQMLL